MTFDRLARMFALMLGATWAVYAGESRLADAVQRQDYKALTALLADKAINIDAAQQDGSTALLWAAHHDAVDVAAKLIQAGANARTPNRYGVFPLVEAAQNGSAAMISLLVRAGADPSTSLGEGDTPLMIASRSGSLAAVKALLDAGAEPNAKESWHGETALMWAAAENHAEVVSALIAKGADANVQAAHLEWPEMKVAPAQVMSKYPPGGLTALMHAARENSVEAARALLKGGADPNKKDPSGLTAMNIAAVNAHYDVALAILEGGADPSDGTLMQAVDARHSPFLRVAGRVDEHTALDLMDALIAKGAKPDVPMGGSVPERKALGGAQSVPVDAPALYRAAKSADFEAMRRLVAAGAKAGHVLKDGSTALIAAAGVGGDMAAQFGGEVPPPEAELVKTLQFLVEHGAGVNAIDGKSSTALHYAVEKGSDEIVEFLASHGAKLDVKDKANRMPLDIANGVAGPPGPMGPRPGKAQPKTAVLLRKLMGLPEDGSQDPKHVKETPKTSEAPDRPAAVPVAAVAKPAGN